MMWGNKGWDCSKPVGNGVCAKGCTVWAEFYFFCLSFMVFNSCCTSKVFFPVTDSALLLFTGPLLPILLSATLLSPPTHLSCILPSYTTLLPIGHIFSPLHPSSKITKFTWMLISVALLIAPVLSFYPTFLLAFSICSYFSVPKMETAGSLDMVVLACECTPCHTTP